MKRTISVFLAAATLATARPVTAEVVDSSPTGFVTQDVVEVEATPDEVWSMLVRPSQYWNPEHSWFGDGSQLFMTFGPGGCFCEIVAGDDSDTINEVTYVEHARVIMTIPGQLLRLSGALGPLQSEALTGILSVELAQREQGGTKITWTYVVGGHSRIPLEQIAPAVDGVMSEQLGRLAARLAVNEN